MNKKLVTFLKMLILSLGLVAVVLIMEQPTKNIQGDKNSNTVRYDFAMGTSVSVSLYDNDVNYNEVTDNIIDNLKFLDEKYLSWRLEDSELGRLNKGYSAGENNEISEELYIALKQSLDICEKSQGALDITIRPLAQLWNIEGDTNQDFAPPSIDSINNSLALVDYTQIEVIDSSNDDGELNYGVCIYNHDMILDLGATGKGYALDKTKEILSENNVEGALVTVGGSILVYGSKLEDEPWNIGIKDPNIPDDSSAMMGYITFPAGTTMCISTSGGYEKYKTYEGKNYHHILDSKTGYPVESDLLSVTVVCENGLVSDGLSTACFVLGYDKSLSLLEKYEAEAVFMDTEGNIYVTDGLKDYWTSK